MPPVVGISCYVEPASWGAWHHVPAALLPHGYVRHVQQSGGVAMLIPPGSYVDVLVPRLNALILAGGADVDPFSYGAVVHPATQESRRDRDDAERTLLQAATDADLPVLGICRGMQLMAVMAGGSLDQHLPDIVGHDNHAPEPGRYGVHRVRVAPGTRLHAILGDQLNVPTHHHQAVSSHPGYRMCAVADDGTIEAIEDPGAHFRLAVQWHPEVGDDPRLFDALLEAARLR